MTKPESARSSSISRAVHATGEVDSSARALSATDVRSVREEFGDGRFADRGVLAGRAHVDRHRRATELECDLETSAARPGEVVAGPGRDEGQRKWSGTESDGRKECDSFGAHRQAEGDVLDDHAGDDVTRSGLHGGSGPELGVGDVSKRSTVPGGGYERSWRHGRQPSAVTGNVESGASTTRSSRSRRCCRELLDSNLDRHVRIGAHH